MIVDAVPLSGAVRLQTPLLLPRNRRLYEGCETACFMDHSGMLVSLPYDLRVSIRHVTSMPQAKPVDNTRSNMHNSGLNQVFKAFLSLVLSHQLAFARFVARNNISNLKRYFVFCELLSSNSQLGYF